MFAVIYRWHVPTAEDLEFVHRWEVATAALRERFGTSGSRLHRDSGGDWVAYAVWPSQQLYHDADTAAVQEVAAMVALVPQPNQHQPIQLAVVSDLLVTSRANDAVERSTPAAAAATTSPEVRG